MRLTSRDATFDAPVDDDKTSPSLFLKSNELLPDEIIEKNEKNLLTNKEEELSKLDDRSKDIIKSRWLTNDKLTLDDLSKKHGVSRERIRQIENESILKLKGKF